MRTTCGSTAVTGATVFVKHGRREKRAQKDSRCHSGLSAFPSGGGELVRGTGRRAEVQGQSCESPEPW